MNAQMEEADVKGRGEVSYFLGEEGETGCPDLTLIQSNFFRHLSLCTAHHLLGEPTSKMAAKLGLALELISICEPAER